MKVSTIFVGISNPFGENRKQIDEQLTFQCQGKPVFIAKVSDMSSTAKPIAQREGYGIYSVDDYPSLQGKQQAFTHEMFEVFLNCAMRAREKALAYVQSLDDDFFDDLIVLGHDTMSHEWIEVLDHGTVHKTEEPDNNTRHYISYPDKEVVNIYDIHRESAEMCGCDICSELHEFSTMSKTEFIDCYSESEWQYWNDNTIEEIILDASHDAGLYADDIREQIIENINNIPYGYFDDEDEDDENEEE